MTSFEKSILKHVGFSLLKFRHTTVHWADRGASARPAAVFLATRFRHRSWSTPSPSCSPPSVHAWVSRMLLGAVRDPLTYSTGWLSWRYEGGGPGRVRWSFQDWARPVQTSRSKAPLPPALPHLIRPPPPRHSCPKVVRVTREFRKGRSLVSTRSCRVSVGSCSAPPRIFRLAGGVWPAQEALHPSQRAFDGLLLKSARVRSAGARAAGPGPSWARSGRWTRHLVASGPSPDLRAHSPPERQGLWAMLR